MTTNTNRLILVIGACLVAGSVLTTRSLAEPAAVPRALLKTGTFSIGMENGYIKSIIDLKSAKDHLPAGHACPVLSVKVAGK